jgi:hypothetical protein
MQAVHDHPQTGTPTPAPAGVQDRRSLARKTRVQRLARAATRGIANRRQRMEARIAIYNELIPVIEQHYRARQRLHRIYLFLLAGLSLALTWVVAVS